MWLDSDRQKVLEWQADKRDHCPQCGQRRSDWLDEDGKVMKDAPFEVVEVLCGGCEALGYHREEARERDAENTRHGIHLAFRRVTEDSAEDISLAFEGSPLGSE